ncbi:hypothetical protein SB00610_04000 [Klebsiella quasipneumoniae subsp. similipneumoniae]|nr:hypothetical protein SB00610_04000 [Klebsiella quasipneumoniae subsp. similipneumoniae]
MAYRVFDRLRVAELHPQMKRRQMRQQNVIDNLPGAGSMLTQDPRRLGQLLQGHLPRQQRRVSRGKHHQLIFEPRLGNNIGGMTRPLDQTEIHPQVGNGVDHVQAVAHAQLNRQIREVMAIAGDDLRHNIVADGAAGVDPNRPVVAAKQLLDLQGPLQQRQGARIEQPSMLIDHQPLADAVEQLYAELPFQIGQRGADRRLRKRQHL